MNLACNRELFTWPTQARFDAILGYDWKLRGRYSLGVQLNVRNVANHYKVRAADWGASQFLVAHGWKWHGHSCP